MYPRWHLKRIDLLIGFLLAWAVGVALAVVEAQLRGEWVAHWLKQTLPVYDWTRAAVFGGCVTLTLGLRFGLWARQLRLWCSPLKLDETEVRSSVVLVVFTHHDGGTVIPTIAGLLLSALMVLVALVFQPDASFGPYLPWLLAASVRWLLLLYRARTLQLGDKTGDQARLGWLLGARAPITAVEQVGPVLRVAAGSAGPIAGHSSLRSFPAAGSAGPIAGHSSLRSFPAAGSAGPIAGHSSLRSFPAAGSAGPIAGHSSLRSFPAAGSNYSEIFAWHGDVLTEDDASGLAGALQAQRPGERFGAFRSAAADLPPRIARPAVLRDRAPARIVMFSTRADVWLGLMCACLVLPMVLFIMIVGGLFGFRLFELRLHHFVAAPILILGLWLLCWRAIWELRAVPLDPTSTLAVVEPRIVAFDRPRPVHGLLLWAGAILSLLVSPLFGDKMIGLAYVPVVLVVLLRLVHTCRSVRIVDLVGAPETKSRGPCLRRPFGTNKPIEAVQLQGEHVLVTSAGKQVPLYFWHAVRFPGRPRRALAQARALVDVIDAGFARRLAGDAP